MLIRYYNIVPLHVPHLKGAVTVDLAVYGTSGAVASTAGSDATVRSVRVVLLPPYLLAVLAAVNSHCKPW